MKKIILLVLLVSALFFSFERVSKTQTKPEKIQSVPDENKPKIVVRKPGEPAELAYDWERQSF